MAVAANKRSVMTLFSFTTDPESVQIDQVSCWLTYTNSKTHCLLLNFITIINITDFFTR